MRHYKYNFSLNCLAGCELPYGDGRLTYTTVETCGDDLSDCLSNATIGIDDWHGNDKGHTDASELSDALHQDLCLAIAEAIAYADESASEAG